MQDIDRSVARVLRLKFLLGLFENPYVDPDRAESVARCAEHRRIALQAARESMILLKNEGSTLPLAKEAA
jgi:beta-glucosidase